MQFVGTKLCWFGLSQPRRQLSESRVAVTDSGSPVSGSIFSLASRSLPQLRFVLCSTLHNVAVVVPTLPHFVLPTRRRCPGSGSTSHTALPALLPALPLAVTNLGCPPMCFPILSGLRFFSPCSPRFTVSLLLT